MDSMPEAFDPSELLGIDVEEASWEGGLVTHRWIEGLFESPEAAEPETRWIRSTSNRRVLGVSFALG